MRSFIKTMNFYIKHLYLLTPDFVALDPVAPLAPAGPFGFFSVSFSHRLILQIWWDLSFRQGAHSLQLSLR